MTISCGLARATQPDTTGYTGVPGAATMSIPLWKEWPADSSGPVQPKGSPLLTIRGSPKAPRIGCGLLKGLMGQWYARLVCREPL